MSKMSREQLAKWEKIRSQGFRRLLWVRGFLGWGVTTGVLWWAMMVLFQPTPSPWWSLLGALVLFPISGLVWGALGVAHFREAMRFSARGRHFPVSGGVQRVRASRAEGNGR